MCCEYLEDISDILGGEILNMKEKEKFLESVKEKLQDKDISKAFKFEDSIDYRFDLVEEDALEQGIEQGIKNTKIDLVKEMLKNNASLEFVSNVIKMSIDEIKEIASSIED